MGETTAEPYVWVLHCDMDGRPGVCAWTRTEREAELKLAELRAEQQQSQFWATALSEEEARRYKAVGMLPPEA